MRKGFGKILSCVIMFLICGVFFVSCKDNSNPTDPENPSKPETNGNHIENIVVSQDFFDFEIYQNDNVDLSQFQVEIENSTDENEQKSLSDLLENLDTTTVGERTINIRYKGYSFSLTYEVKPVEIVNVAYVGEAVSYYLREGFEFNNEKFTIHYSNGKSEELKLSEVELDISEIKNEVGKQTVKGTYEGFEFNVEIDVKKRPITTVVYTGEAVSYYLREGIEFNNEKFTVYYSNGKTEELKLSEAELDISEIKNEVGKQTIKGNYEGFEFDVELDVKKRPITTVVYTDEAVTYYLHEGEFLNGEKFTVLYSNGRTENIELSEAEANFSTIEKQVGKQTILATYEGIEFDVDVEVKTRKIETNKEYKLIDKTGLYSGEYYVLLTETHIKIYTRKDVSDPFATKIKQSETENEWTLKLSLPAPTSCTVYLTAEGLILVETSKIWD